MASIDSQDRDSANSQAADPLAESHSHEPQEHLEAILKKLNVTKVPVFTENVRSKISRSEEPRKVNHIAWQTPLYGMNHILFPIEFEDGVRWLLKVPISGCTDDWNVTLATRLVTEARTLRYIKSQIQIPIPDVFHFDASTENELGLPFILMDYLDGSAVTKVWFEADSSTTPLAQRRMQTLQDLAEMMAKLETFTFSEGGQLKFDARGVPVDMAPIMFLDREDVLESALQGEEPTVFEIGPSPDLQSYLTSLLRHLRPSSDEFRRGIRKLIGLWISWIPYNQEPLAGQFVLAHPDFTPDNVLVDMDGHVTGLIDWDGVAAIPRCHGNRSYPYWLMEDFDVELWTSRGKVLPETLSSWPEERKLLQDTYARLIAKRFPNEGRADRLTRNSEITETICSAAGDSTKTTEVAYNIFAKIERLEAPWLFDEERSDNEESQTLDEGVDDGVESGSEGQNEINKSPRGTSYKSREGENEAVETSDSVERGEDDPGPAYDDIEDSARRRFCLWDVAVDLAKDELDEQRLDMIRRGFLKLWV